VPSLFILLVVIYNFNVNSITVQPSEAYTPLVVDADAIDLTTVSRLMGHKSLTMTLRYSHLAPNHLTSAVNVLNTSMTISTELAQQEQQRATA
jgi:ACR3 family arsenite efflux pump ArsB